MENLDIRILLTDNDLKHKDVAVRMGITPEWFSRCMSRKLKPDMRQRIIETIQEMQVEKFNE